MTHLKDENNPDYRLNPLNVQNISCNYLFVVLKSEFWLVLKMTYKVFLNEMRSHLKEIVLENKFICI